MLVGILRVSFFVLFDETFGIPDPGVLDNNGIFQLVEHPFSLDRNNTTVIASNVLVETFRQRLILFEIILLFKFDAFLNYVQFDYYNNWF